MRYFFIFPWVFLLITMCKSETPKPIIISTNSPIPKSTQILEPTKSVNLVWFYKPPAETDFELLIQNFGFFILTHKDEVARDKLKAIGAEGPFLQYLLLTEIMNPNSCTDNPFGNQSAYKIGDYCKISTENPDWFLVDQYGRRIYYNNFMYFMDPGNSEYRAFWLERAKELQELYGWDGIFIDNVEASLDKVRQLGLQSARYPEDTNYHTAVEEFLSYIRVNYFEPNNKPMFANVVEVNNLNVLLDYTYYLDGIMFESFAVDWSDGYIPVSEWEEQIYLIEKIQQEGKSVILISQGEKENFEREVFSLASYLLIANEKSMFRYTDADFYHQIWIYENYKINLGKPLESYQKNGEIWERRFEFGKVAVNPTTHDSVIKVFLP